MPVLCSVEEIFKNLRGSSTTGKIVLLMFSVPNTPKIGDDPVHPMKDQNHCRKVFCLCRKPEPLVIIRCF